MHRPFTAKRLPLVLVAAVIAVYTPLAHGARSKTAIQWKYSVQTERYSIHTNVSRELLNKASTVAETAYLKAAERLDIHNANKEYIKNLERDADARKKLVKTFRNGVKQYELPGGIILTEWLGGDGSCEFTLPDGRKFPFWRKGMYGQKVSIYMCRDEKELKRSVKDHSRGVSRGGWYVIEGKISYLMNYEEDHRNLDDLAHEISHQIMNYVLYSPPAWLDEGIAMYAGIDEKGRFSEGFVRHDRLDVCLDAMKRRKLVPVGKLIKLNYDKFHHRKKEALHYAESWAFVHFLRHSKLQEVEGKLDEYMSELRKGRDAMDSFNKIYDVDLLDKEFPKYLKTLSRPSEQERQ